MEILGGGEGEDKKIVAVPIYKFVSCNHPFYFSPITFEMSG